MKKLIKQIAVLIVIILLVLSLMIDVSKINDVAIKFVAQIYKLLAIAVMTLFIQIIVHELGHVICGVKNNYSFLGFQILGITIFKQNEKLKLRVDGFTNALGLAIMIPNEDVQDEDQIKFFKAGYIANSITLIPLFIFFILFPSQRILISISIIMTTIMILSNAIPREISGNFNDGYLVKLYKSEGMENELAITIQKLQNELISGRRPADLELQEIAYDENIFAVLINLLMYYKGLDMKDSSLMNSRISLLENRFQNLEKIQKDSIIYELIFYYCYIIGDKLKATKYFVDIENRLEKDMDINARRILAYYYYSARLDLDKAKYYAEQGLEVADKYPIKGIGIMEKQLLNDLLKKIEKSW